MKQLALLLCLTASAMAGHSASSMPHEYEIYGYSGPAWYGYHPDPHHPANLHGAPGGYPALGPPHPSATYATVGYGYPAGISDATYQLDLGHIFSRPYAEQSSPAPAPGHTKTWREELRKTMTPTSTRGYSKDFAWRYMMDGIRYRRGQAPAHIQISATDLAGSPHRLFSGKNASQGISGIVWSDTDTHRIKTKYKNGVVLGRWEFAKKK